MRDWTPDLSRIDKPRYLAIADAKPFESVLGRLIGILVLVATYALLVTIGQLRSKQASQRLAAGVANQPDSGGSRSDSNFTGNNRSPSGFNSLCF